jgi:hypothetical protein
MNQDERPRPRPRASEEWATPSLTQNQPGSRFGAEARGESRSSSRGEPSRGSWGHSEGEARSLLICYFTHVIGFELLGCRPRVPGVFFVA